MVELGVMRDDEIEAERVRASHDEDTNSIFKGITKSVTIEAGDRVFFDGQGLFYWDQEMAANQKNAQMHSQLEDILRVCTPDASVFLTVRYSRTGRTVASMRLDEKHGWFRYSVATNYYIKVHNEQDTPIVLDFRPFKGIELADSLHSSFDNYF